MPTNPTPLPTTAAPSVTPVPTVPLDDTSIRTAVAAWLSDRASAELTYGHISLWGTRGVTDMSSLFYYASAFNENIGAWDTSGVTTMYGMFFGASAFDQDIGAWDTSGVTTMRLMFAYASAFDQDLGWCVADKVRLPVAFYDTPCASTSCGVTQGSLCPP